MEQGNIHAHILIQAKISRYFNCLAWLALLRNGFILVSTLKVIEIPTLYHLSEKRWFPIKN